MQTVVWFLRTLIYDINWTADPGYQRELDRVRVFVREVGLTEGELKLILDQARTKYDERQRQLVALFQKREEFLRFIMTMAAATAAFIAAYKVPAGPLVAASLGCCAAATLILLLSRRVATIPSQLTIQDFREIAANEETEDILAESLHMTCEATRVIERAVAAHLNVALVIISLAIVLLVSAAICGITGF